MKNKKRKNKELQKEIEEFLSGEATKSCKACGGNLRLDRVNLEDYEGGKLYCIEGVPALICESCGETWVPKPFLDEFERMIEVVKKRKKSKGHKKK